MNVDIDVFITPVSALFSCFSSIKLCPYLSMCHFAVYATYLGTEIDMWSLGCILPELRVSYPAFPGESSHDQLDCIREVLGEIPQQLLARRRKQPEGDADSGRNNTSVPNREATMNNANIHVCGTTAISDGDGVNISGRSIDPAAVDIDLKKTNGSRSSSSMQVEDFKESSTGSEMRDQDIETRRETVVAQLTENLNGKHAQTEPAIEEAADNLHRAAAFEKPSRRPVASRAIGDLINARYRDEQFVSFLSRCLSWCPEDRITPEQALSHAWLTNNR